MSQHDSDEKAIHDHMPLSRADLPPEVAAIVDSAERRLMENGEVHAGLYCVSPDGKTFHIPVSEYMESGKLKTLLGEKMVLLAGLGSKSVAFCTEAWSIQTPPGATPEQLKEVEDYAAQGRVHEHPNRREIVMVQAENPQHSYLCQGLITRDESGKVTVPQWNIYRSETAKLVEQFQKHTGSFDDFPRFQFLYYRAKLREQEIKDWEQSMKPFLDALKQN